MSHYRTTFATSVLFLFRFCLVVFVTFNAGNVFGQGKLGRIRSATSGKSEARPSRTAPAEHHSSDVSSGGRKKEKKQNVVSAAISMVASGSSNRQSKQSRNSSSTGKLSQVRNAVRREPPRQQRPTTRPPERNRNRGRRDPFPRPGLGSNQCYRNRPVFAPVPNYAPPAAIIVHETVPVYPAPQTVIVQEAPVLAPPAPVQSPALVSPAVEPMPSITPQAVTEPSPLDAVGVDWFDVGDSRLWASIGSDFDGLTFGTLAASLQAARGLGLDVTVSTIRESGVDFRDNLWLGDVNLMYQVIRRQRLKAKIGAGVNWMGDRFGGDAGFNLTAEAELKLGQNWSFVTHGDFGSLGDADFMHGRVTLNRQLGDAEWKVGAEQYDIGGAKIGSVFTGFGVKF